MKMNIFGNIRTAVFQFASGPIASLGNRSKTIRVFRSLIKNATMDPRRGTHLKPWSRRVLLGALLSMTVPLHADLIDLESGDSWHPEWDEEGNPDPVPDWVPDEAEAAVQNTDMSSISTFGTEVLLDQDMCLRPASEWITSDPGILVKDAMADSAAKRELIASLETWAQGAIEWAAGGQDEVAVGSVSVNNFDCVTHIPLFNQCLIDGYDMFYCLNAWSDINATIPITITEPLQLSGTVTIEATVSHRESTTSNPQVINRQDCVHIVERVAKDFGEFGWANGEVEGYIDEYGPEICF